MKAAQKARERCANNRENKASSMESGNRTDGFAAWDDDKGRRGWASEWRKASDGLWKRDAGEIAKLMRVDTVAAVRASADEAVPRKYGIRRGWAWDWVAAGRFFDLTEACT